MYIYPFILVVCFAWQVCWTLGALTRTCSSPHKWPLTTPTTRTLCTILSNGLPRQTRGKPLSCHALSITGSRKLGIEMARCCMNSSIRRGKIAALFGSTRSHLMVKARSKKTSPQRKRGSANAKWGATTTGAGARLDFLPFPLLLTWICGRPRHPHPGPVPARTQQVQCQVWSPATKNCGRGCVQSAARVCGRPQRMTWSD